jgi:hypothetical protein
MIVADENPCQVLSPSVLPCKMNSCQVDPTKSVEHHHSWAKMLRGDCTVLGSPPSSQPRHTFREVPMIEEDTHEDQAHS